MKLVRSGNKYRVFAADISTEETLPAGFYHINFDPNEGYALSKEKPLSEITERVYGPHRAKAHKIMGTFLHLDRSLGVLISGEKGIGKSLTSRLLMEDAISRGYPVILVDEAHPYLAKFLGSIDQEAVFVFDEFEKTFHMNDHDESETTQEDLLPLFDGMSSAKHLRILTANEADKVSSFFLNRPGRIHYHLQYDSIDTDTYTEYLSDNLVNPDYRKDIDQIATYCNAFALSFDELRAVCLELNLSTGETPFAEVLEDVNINSKDEHAVLYRPVTITARDERTGYVYTVAATASIDLEESMVSVAESSWTNMGNDINVTATTPGGKTENIDWTEVALGVIVGQLPLTKNIIITPTDIQRVKWARIGHKDGTDSDSLLIERVEINMIGTPMESSLFAY